MEINENIIGQKNTWPAGKRPINGDVNKYGKYIDG
jgi:hypothetical protein